ncbi:MAG: AGE family epimerase/isomerase [Arachnia propionica]|uniref:AGE family epimerase/isomerase n=1 Tax=Arachnia propionica TaxID=1750 RepID=UPI0026F8D17E|nr:AGE family epimerase/isomerase [Arachnia propionica]
MSNWLRSPDHTHWLRGETRRLLDFARNCPVPGLGAAWLNSDGSNDPARPPATWSTCRMVHCYALGHLLGVPGSRPVAQAAMSGLTGALRDEEHGGWFDDASGDGPAGKQAYAHAFVVLAACSAVAADLDGAVDLLQEALGVYEGHFLDDDGLVIDSWNRDFSTPSDYRGINATMHGVEALLAAADATGDPHWLRRAAHLAAFAAGQAALNGWRMPEHFTPDWEFLPDYNEDHKADQFRPYGATVGHGLEWARLLLHVESALEDAGLGDLPGPTKGWAHAAKRLYRRAVADGWARNGLPGFLYTTDWDGTPVVEDRLHWVTAEAIGAAATLWQRTGKKRYARDYARWWDFAAVHLLDLEAGSWHHELDPGNEPAGKVWPGKPDLYHALQATLIPTLPLSPVMAFALREAEAAA